MRAWQGIYKPNRLIRHDMLKYPSQIKAMMFGLRSLESCVLVENNQINFNLTTYQRKPFSEIQKFLLDLLCVDPGIPQPLIIFYVADTWDMHVPKTSTSYKAEAWGGIEDPSWELGSHAMHQFYTELVKHILERISCMQANFVGYQRDHAMHKCAVASWKAKFEETVSINDALKQRNQELQVINKQLCQQLEKHVSKKVDMKAVGLTTMYELKSQMLLMKEHCEAAVKNLHRQLDVMGQLIQRQNKKFDDYANFLADDIENRFIRSFHELDSPLFGFDSGVPEEEAHESRLLIKSTRNAEAEFSRITTHFMNDLEKVWLHWVFHFACNDTLCMQLKWVLAPELVDTPTAPDDPPVECTSHKRSRRSPE
jgi:hypothetical protein